MCCYVGWTSCSRSQASGKLVQLRKQEHDQKHGTFRLNKRFLALTAGVPSSTHDARLLRWAKVFKYIIAGDAIPDKAINLGDKSGEIPLTTIGDTAFPRFAWLLKMFNENTKDPKERRYSKKLCRANVFAEHC